MATERECGYKQGLVRFSSEQCRRGGRKTQRRRRPRTELAPPGRRPAERPAQPHPTGPHGNISDGLQTARAKQGFSMEGGKWRTGTMHGPNEEETQCATAVAQGSRTAQGLLAWSKPPRWPARPRGPLRIRAGRECRSGPAGRAGAPAAAAAPRPPGPAGGQAGGRAGFLLRRRQWAGPGGRGARCSKFPPTHSGTNL